MMLRIVLRVTNTRVVQYYARTVSDRAESPEVANQATNLPLTVKQVYKNLLHLGKDFPKGYTYFRDRCKSAFLKNRNVTDPQQIEVLLARAVYVTKELEALYMLKKYRTLKKRYYAEELK